MMSGTLRVRERAVNPLAAIGRRGSPGDMANLPNFIEVQKYLGGVDYPCSKSQLIEAAEGNSAPQEVLDALNGLSDRDYDGPTAVSSELA
jgi:hypothetical protein